MQKLMDLFAKRGTFVQRWVDQKVPGRLNPQPNESMFATKIVKKILGLK